METEPNKRDQHRNVVTVPVCHQRRLDGVRDLDVFKFKSEKEQRLICSVAAQRFGSSLDALLTLTDATGKSFNKTTG